MSFVSGVLEEPDAGWRRDYNGWRRKTVNGVLKPLSRG